MLTFLCLSDLFPGFIFLVVVDNKEKSIHSRSYMKGFQENEIKTQEKK